MAEVDDAGDQIEDEPVSLASVSDITDLEEVEPGTAVLRLGGEIDIASLPEVQDALDEILERRDPRVVVFDLSELRFMDSSGLALLLGVAVQVEAVQVRNPSGIVRRVIEISGLAEALPITL
jgi:anti-anti-sigma factor